MHPARAEDAKGRVDHREPQRSRRQRRGASRGQGGIADAEVNGENHFSGFRQDTPLPSNMDDYHRMADIVVRKLEFSSTPGFSRALAPSIHATV
jgi:hypothetical protein